MKYMVVWRIAPGNHRQAAEAFLRSGAPMPDGLKMLGRWHAPGSAKGWVLVEGDDPVALAQHAADWSSMLETDITPVLDDEGAGQALGRTYGG